MSRKSSKRMAMTLGAILASTAASQAAVISYSSQIIASDADTSWVNPAFTQSLFAYNFGGDTFNYGGVTWLDATNVGGAVSGNQSTAMPAWFSLSGIAWGTNTTTFYPTNTSNLLLHQGAWLGSSAARIEFYGLQAGLTYQVQYVLADSRPGAAGRAVTLTGLDDIAGQNSATTQYAYGDSRFAVVTATFTADAGLAANGMKLIPLLNGGAGTQINGMQIRQILPVTVTEGIVAVSGASLYNNGPSWVFIHKDANDDFDNGQAPELQRTFGALSSLAGIGATEVGGLGTVATILAGSTNAATSVDMAFRGRNNAIVAGETSLLSSDILQLEGLDGVVFVLQMSYSEAAALANGQAETTLRLGYLNTALNRWEDAVLGNHGTNTGSFFLSSYLDAGSPIALGSYGVDIVNNVVWAVLDHNSFFAVIPAPGALPAGMLLMGLVIAAKRRRKA